MMRKKLSRKYRVNRLLIKNRKEINIDILIKYWIIFRVKILMKIASTILLSAYKYSSEKNSTLFLNISVFTLKYWRN